MVVNTIVLIAAGTLSMVLVAQVFSRLGLGPPEIKGLQLIVNASLAAGAVVYLGISYLLAGVIVLLPVFLTAFSFLFYKRRGKKMLNGEYSEQSKWAAEMILDDDEEFAAAIEVLPNTEVKEIGIIAESKDDLRARTIERAEDKADE